MTLIVENLGVKIKTDGRFNFIVSSKLLADQIQQICLHIGWDCVIENEIELSINILVKDIIVNEEEEKEDEEKYIENEKCPVFCLQVSSEVFYVRRNGKCAWTANSRSQGHVTTLNALESKDNFKRVYLVLIIKAKHLSL